MEIFFIICKIVPFLKIFQLATGRRAKGQQSLKHQEFSSPELLPVYSFLFCIFFFFYLLLCHSYNISFSDLTCYSPELERAQFTGECSPSCSEYPILCSNHLMDIKIQDRV